MGLPRPSEHRLLAGATIVVPVPAAGLTVHRLLQSGMPRLSNFEPGWTRPQGQLRSIPEVSRTSVSAWLEQAQAAAASNRRVAYVARLALLDEPLTRVALTEHGGYGHVDVWAYPRTLLGAVVDVIRIRA